MTRLMYTDKTGERLPTWNPHPGCQFNCYYCYGRTQYARFSKCTQCKAFKPHFHPERMKQTFKEGRTYFVESLGDPAFIPTEILQQIFSHLAKFPKTTFMLQSKNPRCFADPSYYIPYNVWLGTTIETDIRDLAECYSRAPLISERYWGLRFTQDIHPKHHYYITFEPIMICNKNVMLDFALDLKVDAVYIGRDNHKNHLPEPSEDDLNTLVELLQNRLGTEKVHCKTLGKAWWERK